MKTLPTLLNFVITTLQLSPIISVVRIISTRAFSQYQFTLKVRAELTDGSLLQVRLYRNGTHIDYAYQLVRHHKPVMRWDNKEHFPAISSYPHHFHHPFGHVEASPLTGDPADDLPEVLNFLTSTLTPA